MSVQRVPPRNRPGSGSLPGPGEAGGELASRLFEPFEQRGMTLRNRLGVAPMCTYSADAMDGLPTAWHVAHLGARAIGGFGLVIAEATAVEARGRISPQDLGLWSDAHVDAWRPVTAAVAAAGAVPGVQLAHAGRKASTFRPWAPRSGRVPVAEGGWVPVGPTTEPFRPEDGEVEALTEAGIAQVVEAFAAAAARAVDAGLRMVEVHGAHGYLLHEFLTPLVNRREDAYGGSAEGRERLLLEVVGAVRAAVPEDVPVWLRLSATDWVEGGLAVEDTVRVARRAREAGVDLVDCSSSGAVPYAKVPAEPGYQVPFASAVRAAGVPSAAVGLITTPAQAEAVVAAGHADVVLIGREALRDPHFPLRAARELGVPAPWPPQYLRAAPGA